MWRFMSLYPTSFNNGSNAETYAATLQFRMSSMRAVILIIFIIFFTSIISLASINEHFNYFCIVLLLMLLLFFAAYLASVKSNWFSTHSVETLPTVGNEYTWSTATDSSTVHIRNESQDWIFKEPPSYESIVKDANYKYALPPPYSTVIPEESDRTTPRTINQSESGSTLTSSTQIIIDVRKLSHT